MPDRMTDIKSRLRENTNTEPKYTMTKPKPKPKPTSRRHPHESGVKEVTQEFVHTAQFRAHCNVFLRSRGLPTGSESFQRPTPTT